MTTDTPRGFDPLIPTYQASPGTQGRKYVFQVPQGHEHEFGGLSVVTSQFDLGAEPHHSDIYKEYEMTFGHRYTKEDERRDVLNGDSPLAKEYRAIAPRVVKMMQSADKEQAQAIIEELQAFRTRHPELYA